jgi:hypothetical protein
MSEHSSSQTTNIVPNCKDAVHEWMKIQDFIGEHQAIIRQKRKRMQQLEYYITTYLKDNNKDYCNIGDKEALCMKSKKTTGSLKREHILNFLKDKFKSEETAIEYTKQLFDMREVKEKNMIQRLSL